MEKEASESGDMMTLNPQLKLGKRRFSQGIQAKLILILLTLLIPTLLIQVFIYHDRLLNRRAEELQANLEIARSLAKTFDAALQDVLHQELSIGLALASKGLSTDNQDKLLNASKEANPAIWHFFWDNPAGIVVAATGSQFVGMDISDREFYREIIAGKDWVVSDLLLSKTTQQPSFTISRGIRNEQGELLGIIVAAVLPKHLDAVLGIERVKDAAINIMDSKGMVVYRHPATEFTWEERNLLKNYPDLQTVLDSNELVMAYPSRITGKNRLAGYAPIRSIGWIASSSRDEETVMASTNSSLILHANLIISITLMAFGVALFFSRRLATIIAQLRDNALALGRGDSISPVAKSSTAELNDLAKAFHKMTEDLQLRERERKLADEKLRLSEEALRQANEHLEQRVRERTMDLQNLTKQLERSHQELRKLAAELVMAEERERKRIAGVLHDEIAQTLAAVRMRLDLFRDVPSDQKDKTLQEAKELLLESIQETRGLMNDLGNPLLFDLGLKAACEALANRMMERSPTRISCDIREPYKNLDPDMKMILYQIVRELLNNIVKHSKAQNAHVRIDSENEHYRVKVTDDGVGFEPQALGAPTAEGGFGLYSMRERLIAVDGNLVIESSPGAGTVVTAILPTALD